MSFENHQILLAARPVGVPTAETWEHRTEELGAPGPGRFLVKVRYVSLDPAMRTWISAAKSYIDPVEIGDVMRAFAIAEVVASEHDGFAVGDIVHSFRFGVQEYADSDGVGVDKVDPSAAELPTFLGALGLTGLTAYFGLLEEGKPVAGETVVVSGAAGAVGSVVGQLAKLKGCRVIGIAGSAPKRAWLVDELGFDAAIDYRAPDVPAALHAAAPCGIDVFFDNVGGQVLDDALAQLRVGARVIICGAISQYNATASYRGPTNYFSLMINRASMKGIFVNDYVDRFGQAAVEMGGWIADGKINTRAQVVDGGVGAFPGALLKLFAGENTGKLVLRVG